MLGFTKQDWSDAFPIYPPTREAGDALIAGTSLSGDDLGCDMPQDLGWRR
ncbi:MAG: hypothetical protein CM1200mP38_7850 [Dehalococcoidia bacterium]|nr:MAG: hypothetical protein CM1200mP38_7850 [Dehalococcoidia bacterium]